MTPPQFVSEQVILEVAANRVIVHGRYTIASAESCAILYPFTLAPPDSAWVTVAGGKGAWLKPDESGIRVVLPPTLAGGCVLEVAYDQPVSGRHAAYLLRSARAWERPIRKAVLEVVFPEALGTPDFSYPFRRVGPGRWQFVATEFAPDRDLTIDW